MRFPSVRTDYVFGYTRIQMSANGGMQPHWRNDGKEIFYIAPDGQMTAVEVNAKGASLEVGQVRSLFGGLPANTGPPPYDVAPGGQRFLVDVPPEKAAAEPLTVVQNWRQH